MKPHKETVTIWEVESSWCSHLPTELPERVGAVIESVADNFDGQECERCMKGVLHTENLQIPLPSPIGWVLAEDEYGHSEAAFIPFWVVDNGKEAWVICEDCNTITLGRE